MIVGKKVFKGLFYSVFKLLSFKSRTLSGFLTSWGYVIRSEAMYNHSKVPDFPDRLDMHEHLASKYINPEDPITFMEFGVYKGESYAIWVKNNKNPRSTFHGFDTFTGLPEDWGSVKKGTFSAGGILPDINDPRNHWHIGLIQDTLPVFIKELSADTRKVIHIDVDLYNATLITLVLLQPLLRKGDVIIFDDFFTFTKSSHEFKAFYDFVDLYNMPYKPIFKCRNGHLVIEML